MKKAKSLVLVGLLLIFALMVGVLPLGQVAAEPANGGPPVKVLIAFDRQPGPNEQAIVHGAGGKVKYTYDLVPAIAATVPEAAIDALLRNPRVLRVEPDVEVHAVDTELAAAWGVERIGAGTVHDAGNKGTGVRVAVIDSGVDYTHSDLNANYAGGYDFVNDDDYPMDDAGHGTHVAGTIAAEDNGSGVVGVAPEADIYALKVLGANGSGSFSDVIAALQWCVDNDIQVTNNSYGSSIDPGMTVHQAFDNARVAGIVNVAAAGNSGNPRGKGDNVIYPAAYDSVIAVAATDSDDNRASFSSTGPAVEIAAPGVSIYSTIPGGGYAYYSGTSMASPHAAGTAALVIASGVSGVANVRAALTSTAEDLGATGRDNLYGFGLVDAAAAVEAASPPPADTTAPSITNVEASPATNSATITWTTDEQATSAVDYGTTTSYGSTVSDSSYVASHSLTLTGLQPDTTYHYRVESTDAAGNAATSADYSFTTSAGSVTPGETMHVGDLDGISAAVNKNIWHATVSILVHAADETPVEGATVSGTWSGSYSGTSSCTTDSSGWCSVTSGNIRNVHTEVTFTVTDVSHTSLAYEPTANEESSIAVSK